MRMGFAVSALSMMDTSSTRGETAFLVYFNNLGFRIDTRILYSQIGGVIITSFIIITFVTLIAMALAKLAEPPCLEQEQ